MMEVSAIWLKDFLLPLNSPIAPGTDQTVFDRELLLAHTSQGGKLVQQNAISH